MSEKIRGQGEVSSADRALFLPVCPEADKPHTV